MPESGKLIVGTKVEKSDGIMAPMLITVADMGLELGLLNISSKMIGTRIDRLLDL